MPGETESSSTVFRKAVTVRVVQMHVERLQAAQHREADPAGGDRADMHALEIIGTLGAIGDVPSALDHPLVRRDIVAHQAQNHHHHVFRDTDGVAVGDLSDRDLVINRRLQVDMVRANAGGDRKLEVLRPGDAFGGQIGGPERL